MANENWTLENGTLTGSRDTREGLPSVYDDPQGLGFARLFNLSLVELEALIKEEESAD